MRTLMTGTWPAQNGIIGNDWFDRDAGKIVTSVSDDGAKPTWRKRRRAWIKSATIDGFDGGR
ncbi:MAG: alkaline phosphatase family protein [Pyrinomonadaceae bacterium]